MVDEFLEYIYNTSEKGSQNICEPFSLWFLQ